MRLTIFCELFCVQGNFICALNTQAKLRYSMVLTRIEIEREKLEMKLDGILQSQVSLYCMCISFSYDNEL